MGARTFDPLLEAKGFVTLSIVRMRGTLSAGVVRETGTGRSLLTYIDGWMRALMQRRGGTESPERARVPTTQSRATPSMRAQLRNATYEEGASALAPTAREPEPEADPLRDRRANHAIQANEHARIAAAIRERNLDPGSIAGLQGYLAAETDWDVKPSGTYDLTTARAVHDMDPGTGGLAEAQFFADRGLFYFARGAELIPPAFDQVAARHPEGLTVSLYANYGNRHQGAEFRRRADEHAQLYGSMGVDGDAAIMGLAIPINSVEEVPQRLHQISRAVECSWRQMVDAMCSELGQAASSPAQVPKFCKIRNVALFAHGMHYGLSMNRQNSYNHGLTDGRAGWRESNVRGLALTASGVLTEDVRVQLFACNAGSSERGDGDWNQPTAGDQGGEESYASKLQEALNATGKDSTVFAHITAGHTTENVSARVFGAEAERAGEGGTSASLLDVVFPADYVAAQAEERGWTVEQTREKLWKFLKKQIYRGSAPRGSEGMELFSDIEGMGEEMRTRFDDHS